MADDNNNASYPRELFYFVGLMISIPFLATNMVLIVEYDFDSVSSSSLLMAVEIISLLFCIANFYVVDFKHTRKGSMLRFLIYSGFVLAITVNNIIGVFQCVQNTCHKAVLFDLVSTLAESFFGGALLASLVLFHPKNNNKMKYFLISSLTFLLINNLFYVVADMIQYQKEINLDNFTERAVLSALVIGYRTHTAGLLLSQLVSLSHNGVEPGPNPSSSSATSKQITYGSAGALLGLFINLFSVAFSITGEDDFIISEALFFGAEILAIASAVSIFKGTKASGKAAWNWEILVLLLFYCGILMGNIMQVIDDRHLPSNWPWIADLLDITESSIVVVSLMRLLAHATIDVHEKFRWSVACWVGIGYLIASNLILTIFNLFDPWRTEKAPKLLEELVIASYVDFRLHSFLYWVWICTAITAKPIPDDPTQDDSARSGTELQEISSNRNSGGPITEVTFANLEITANNEREHLMRN